MASYHSRIRKYRKIAHLSQRELCVLVGLRSQGDISELESGARRPGLSVALALAMVLNTTVADLFPQLNDGVTKKVLRNTNLALTAKPGRRLAGRAHMSAVVKKLERHDAHE